MTKIDKLTPSQEIELIKFRDESLKFGRSIEPINHERAEMIIGRFYKRIGKEIPEFIYLPSPYACCLEVNKHLWSNLGSNLGSNLWSNLWSNLESNLRSNLRSNLESNLWSNLGSNLGSNLRSNLESNLRSNLESNLWSNLGSNYFAGQQWLAWSHFYKFCENIGVTYDKKDSELLDEWIEEGRNLHWWFPFERVCLISERPISLNLNSRGQLHHETNKSIEYADGYGFYSLNGITVPAELVTTPAEDLSLDFFKNEKNADIKAEFVRKFGVERMLDFGTKIDDYSNYDEASHEWWYKSEYQLWDMKNIFPGLNYQPYLKMTNCTTGIFHVEAVSPNCRTIKDALKERFGGRDMKIAAIA